MDNYREQYAQQGYFLVPHLFNNQELIPVKEVLQHFHQAWLQDNSEFYHQGAVNSAYLTSGKYLEASQRLVLFQFIACDKLAALIESVFDDQVMFVGSQLFFNPANPEQKNYWHRDPQYHLSLDEQKAALTAGEALHFRVALEDEPGLELVPGTHRRWDSTEELATRMELEGKTNSDPLESGHVVPIQAGDLLVFSANMIHRGLYGKERLAFDILFGECRPEFAEFIPPDCLPDAALAPHIDNYPLFERTLKFKGLAQS